MFEYKNAAFFSEFFRFHPDFELLEEFKVSEDKEEKNLYVGKVEVKNTVHPLIIRVEIPFTFPHNKLTFRTTSLNGYPHLIHSGKIQYGDWFCLNTPFAETVEEQLNQEIIRLKEWIERQMTPELLPIIKDAKVQHALAVANAYEWENPDEVNEFSAKAQLTLIGNYFNSLSTFEEKQGNFHCIKSPDGRFYAFCHSIPGENYKLPYIIVDEFPKNTEVLEDFLRLKDFYNWDENTCKHLLPDSKYYAGKRYHATRSDKYNISYTESEALTLVEKVKEELEKETSFLKESKRSVFDSNIPKQQKVSPKHKLLILSELDRIRKEIVADGGIKCKADFWHSLVGSPEYEEWETEQEIAERWYRWDQYICDYFVIGFESKGHVRWVLFSTTLSSLRSESISYDIEVGIVNIYHTLSLTLYRNKPQEITKKMYFGRGSLNTLLSEKKIALVGLGAIGSMVAEILAHGGVNIVGLWDSDIVEPGNICRAAFTLNDLGKSKVETVAEKIQSINPFIEIKDIVRHGDWLAIDPNISSYVNGSFYDNVNYSNQEDALKEIKEYDLIIDCTGSNEMLHFLSYAIKDKEIISLCITNHSNELLCVTNVDGNPFELRKAYLSRIEQDTRNYYAEGEGCYSPTFLAKYSDIAALVNLCIKELDGALAYDMIFHSAIYSYINSGILIDRINTYRLEGYDIILNIPEESLLDAMEFDYPIDSNLGYIFGCYSSDRKQILITHIVSAETAMDKLQEAYSTSKGIIDYIGDYTYSNNDSDSFSKDMLDIFLGKALDSDINTNNPLLALRTKNGDIDFYLYINNQLVPFKK